MSAKIPESLYTHTVHVYHFCERVRTVSRRMGRSVCCWNVVSQTSFTVFKSSKWSLLHM